VENSDRGETDGETLFHYCQDGEVISATYKGGGIRAGSLIGKVDDEGNMDIIYHHINAKGDFVTGKCRSVPEVLPDGRIRLKEKWQRTCGDCPSGESTVEEIERQRELIYYI